MTSDLWGPSSNQVPQETSNSCNFCAGYGVDVIEENTLNEISCIQVLRILISKANTEIDELKKQLISLNSELAWVEDEEWYNICCNALKEKIDCLNISLRSLRSRHEDWQIECFKMQEPAERIDEILKGLLTIYHQKNRDKNVPPLDVYLKESTTHVPGRITDLLNVNNSASDSDSIAKDNDHQAISCISKEYVSIRLFPELQDEISISSKNCKSTKTIAKNSCPDTPVTTAFHSSEEGKTDFDSKTRSEESRAAITEASTPETLGCAYGDSDAKLEASAENFRSSGVKTAAGTGQTRLNLKDGIDWNKESENFPLASIFKLHDYKSKSTFKFPREKEDPSAGVAKVLEVSQSEVVRLDPLLMEPQQKGKRKMESNPLHTKRSVCSRVTSETSLASKSEEQSKKKMRNVTSAVQPKMNQQKCPASTETIDASDEQLTEKVYKEDQLMTVCGGTDDPAIGLVAATKDLEHLTLGLLKDIARKKKLKGYSKLGKRQLVEHIAKAQNTMCKGDS